MRNLHDCYQVGKQSQAFVFYKGSVFRVHGLKRPLLYFPTHYACAYTKLKRSAIIDTINAPRIFSFPAPRLVWSTMGVYEFEIKVTNFTW